LKRSAQVGEMRVLQKIMDLNVKQLSDATQLEVESKYRSINQEFENIQLGLKNMESAKEGVRIAELNYREGMITILELNSSYNELTRAKVNFLQALYNYNIAIAELEKITGINFNGGVA
jgi:outer membrane protein TolC